MALHFLITAFIEYILRKVHGNWHDNHNQHDNDAQDDAQTHLHVFPPHVLAHSVGTTAEALGADGKIICFVLDRVQALASFGNLVDVVSHDADGVVDLLHMLVRVRGNRVGKKHTAWMAAVLEFDWSPVVWLGMYGSYGTLEDIVDIEPKRWESVIDLYFNVAVGSACARDKGVRIWSGTQNAMSVRHYPARFAAAAKSSKIPNLERSKGVYLY